MKELICIVCPRGCRLNVDENNKVTGNFCKRGETYALQEIAQPMRMITSTVALKGSHLLGRLPVMTDQEVPKDRIFDVMKEIYKIEVSVPVTLNQVIIKDVCGLGVNIISTCEIKE